MLYRLYTRSCSKIEKKEGEFLPPIFQIIKGLAYKSDDKSDVVLFREEKEFFQLFPAICRGQESLWTWSPFTREVIISRGSVQPAGTICGEASEIATKTHFLASFFHEASLKKVKLALNMTEELPFEFGSQEYESAGVKKFTDFIKKEFELFCAIAERVSINQQRDF